MALDAAATPAQGLACCLVPIDMTSPDPCTLAGGQLANRMKLLIRAGCRYHHPMQQVSALTVSRNLLQAASVVVAGSPTNRDSENNVASDDSKSGSVRFKEEAFYSLCWGTGSDTLVVLTYSASACGCLEYWLNKYEDDRVLVVGRAWFALCRPRCGAADYVDRVGHCQSCGPPDTMVAMYAPPRLMGLMASCWNLQGQLDVAAVIRKWMCSSQGTLLTFATYTAELEVDVCGCAPAPEGLFETPEAGEGGDCRLLEPEQVVAQEKLAAETHPRAPRKRGFGGSGAGPAISAGPSNAGADMHGGSSCASADGAGSECLCKKRRGPSLADGQHRGLGIGDKERAYCPAWKGVDPALTQS